MALSTDRGEPGLFLQISVEDVVRVSLAAWIPRVSRAQLRSPLLTDNGDTRLAGTSELVLAMLDEGGHGDRFAWSTRSIAFMDREDEEETGALRGTPRDSKLNVRALRFPVTEETRFLFFYKTELFMDERVSKDRPTLSHTPMGLYFMGGPDVPFPPIPPLPFPPLVPPLPWRLPWRPPHMLVRPYRPPRVPNYVAGSGTLVDNGNPADRFDIVILGDGFTFPELGEFDVRAAALANGLIAMPPFNAVANKINIHTIRAVSLASGISDCPAPGVMKSTYFNVRGNFNGQYPGFVGTATPERIYQAAELIAPREHLEVFLVVANCAIEGGSAFPPQRLAFVTMYADMTKFVNIAAHELAHVIAGSAEEYIGCGDHDPLAVYPNQATEAQRTANATPWLPLALANELDGMGLFRAQHVSGDPFDANNEPIVAAPLRGMLGAYWGCQDIDPALSTSGTVCDPYQDPRGIGYFRPMARCRMRKSFFDFCRVCAGKLTDAVNAAAP